MNFARSIFVSFSVLILVGCQSLPTASSHVSGLEAERSGREGFSWPPGLRVGQPLTDDQCVAVALWNQPDYQAALADLGIARSEIVRAGQIVNPTLASFFPSQEKALELTARLPLEVLWLRPKRVLIAGVDRMTIWALSRCADLSA